MSLLEYMAKSYLADQAGKKPIQPRDPSKSLIAVGFGANIRLYNLYEETYSDLLVEPLPKPKKKKKPAATAIGAMAQSYDFAFTGSYPLKIQFDPTGRYLAVLQSNGSLYIWDVATQSQLPIICPEIPRGFNFSPDGNRFIFRGEAAYHIFDVPSFAEWKTITLNGLGDDLYDLPYRFPFLLTDSAQAVILGHFHLHALNLATGISQSRVMVPTSISNWLVRSASGDLLYANNGTIRRFSQEYGLLAGCDRDMATFEANPAWDLFCYVCSDTGRMYIMDSQTFETEFQIPESSGFSYPKFSADGYHLLYYSENSNEIHIRDIRNPSCQIVGIIPLPFTPSCAFDLQPQLAFPTT